MMPRKMKRMQRPQPQQKLTTHKEGMYLERNVKNPKAQIRSSSKIALKYLSNGNIFRAGDSAAIRFTQVGCVELSND